MMLSKLLKAICILLLVMAWHTVKAQGAKPRPLFDDQVRGNTPPDFSALKSGDFTKINDAYNKTLDAAFQLDQSYDFELRFWQLGLMASSHQAFVLRYQNRAWSARLFQAYRMTDKGVEFVEKPVNQQKLKRLWQLLQQEKLLSLPNYESIRPLIVKYQIDTATLETSGSISMQTDGILYVFELKTPTAKRSYQYGNPETMQKEYPNIEALCHAVVLVRLIDRYMRE
jgi:hypothetical protein